MYKYFSLIGLRASGLLVACVSAVGAPTQPTPASTLEAVVVTSQKLSVETLIDRKVYSVAADVQATFGTVSDVLGAIPSVDVDPDGKISLRGDGNVLILIDGKPSTQFAGSAAGENLKLIPANDIERIEVITTPPPQFKADGAAGVINIVTRKKRPGGTAGSLQGSFGSGGRSVLGASASYRSGPLTASTTLGFRHDYRDRSVASNVRSMKPAVAQLSDSSINERIRRQSPTAVFSAEYTVNDRQTLSGSLSWMRRGGLRTFSQVDNSSDPFGALTHSTGRLSYGHDPEDDFDAKWGFSKMLGGEGEVIEISFHRSSSHQYERYDYTNASIIPPTADVYNNLSFHEDHGTTEGGFDYSVPLSQSRSIQLGYAFEQDDFGFDNFGNDVDPISGAQIPDPNLTNHFQFRQRINAGYASYSASINEWSVLAGLRAELTCTDAQQLTDAMRTSASYLKVYPSLHLARSLTEKIKLSLGASRRVSRPNPSDLNPYVDHEYTPNLNAGNPDLQPQFTQSYEVGYGYEGRGTAFQVTGYYRRNQNSVTAVTQYLGNGYSLTTQTNLPRNDAAGLEITSNGQLAPKVVYSVSANLFHSQIDARALGIPGLQSTEGINAKVKLDYRPTPDDSLQVLLTRTDKRLTPQGYIDAIDIVNLGYRHLVTADLTAIATVSDIFNGQRYERLESTPSFTAEYRRSTRGRVVYLGLIYSFGTTKKDKSTLFDYDQAG